MTFLPIVGRELGVAARRPGTYWLRFGAVLGTLLLFGTLLLRGDPMTGGVSKGVYILNALGVLALGFCLLAGVFQTADCISEEKREGTIGLLFLTDLKAYDVVSGKLVASSINVFFGLLAVFPVLGLAMLVGGVTWPEFCRLQLVFITTLFFSLGVGMFVSSISRDARQAIMRALLIVLIFGGVLPLVWWLYRLSGMTKNLDWILIPSPAYGYMKAFESRYNYVDGPGAYWGSLGTVFGLGLLGIVLATFILPRTWQDKGTVVPKRKRKERRLERRRGVSDGQRLRWLGWNPMFWLAARDSVSHRIAVKALLLLVPLWALFYAACYWVNPRAEVPFIICMFFAYGLHLIIKALIAAEASRRINEDRQSGALELLLVTPLPVRAILSGQMQALRHHFKGPVAVLLLLNFALCWLVVSNPKPLDINGRDVAIFLELFAGGAVMLVLDFYTLGWVGMWRGLNATKHHRAVVGAVLRVMGIPWIFVFLLVFMRIGFRGPEGVIITFAIWFLTGAVVDVIVGVVARQRLHALFRWTAASRFRRG
jgi:ABC-type transport system involved in multi-copper enzyme maturation permease subunit